MRDEPVRFGRYLDDFRVGETFLHIPSRLVSEEDNRAFCLLTHNHHPLHLDHAYAATTRFGRPVVVGTFVLSLTVGMTVADLSGRAIANLEYEKVIHHAPVFFGDVLTARSEVLDVVPGRRDSSRGVVTVRTETFNQNGVKVLSLVRRFLVPRGTEER